MREIYFWERVVAGGLLLVFMWACYMIVRSILRSYNQSKRQAEEMGVSGEWRFPKVKAFFGLFFGIFGMYCGWCLYLLFTSPFRFTTSFMWKVFRMYVKYF